MQATYRNEEADTLGGGAAAADETHEGDNTSDTEDCHSKPV